ncbi:MAG TPA: diguanylate cyclase [Aeromonadales bacterium]|nr:diguanylate cyclase [Aeromonadales bacterium]
MPDTIQQFKEFHWMMDLLQTIDVGLIVLDRNLEVKVWNSFMENHSGIPPRDVKGKNLFELFPEINKAWFKNKLDSVCLLKNRAFSSWEQRPYLIRFKNYRPITGTAGFMYQNITINPLLASTGEVEQLSIVVYDVTDVAVKKLELNAANLELEHLSRTDALTQLYNRGFWEENLVSEFTRFQRYQQPTTLVMFDIDHFKKVNDTYGHPAGDEALRQTSMVLQQSVRSTDVAGRYGGEEFGIILPETEAKAALIFCERLRKSIENLEINHESHRFSFTASLGVAELTAETPTPQKWLENADQALFKSKNNGRNQTTVFN